MKRSLLVLLLVTPAAQAEVLQFADRFRMVTVSDPQISPDGRTIALVVSRPNVKANRFDTEVVLVEVATATQRPLTFERRGVAQPRWAPEGSRLAFLARVGEGEEARRQVWTIPMAGGDARRLTDAPEGVQQYAWSPDGTHVAYVTEDAGPPAADDLARLNRSFEVQEDDFLTRKQVRPSHIWIIPAAGGEPRRLTSGEWSLPVARPPGPLPSPINWSPDGRSITFTRLESPSSGRSDTARVAVVDVQTGAVRRLTTATVAETQPFFSPDGRLVAFNHPHRGERQSENRVWTVGTAGGTATQVTAALDRNVYRALWMPDGKSLLVGAHHETTTALWLQPAAGGEARRLDLGDLEPYAPFSIDAHVSKTGAIALTGSTPRRPRELYYMESAAARPRRLTDFNAPFESLELGRAERITFSNEGFDLDGVVVTPPRFDPAKKYPLVLYIHGGPRSSSTTAFSFLPQILAAQGWMVFQPNYRGSDNLGNRVTRAILEDAGAGPGRDVMAGLEALKARGQVDDGRIVVGGWSYGGYMTSWMIGHYPIFKAAVSGAAVNNFLDQYTLGDFNVQRGAVWGSPYVGENMKKYLDMSPITYASAIKTPTLILSNTGDARVPVTQSFQMFRALKDNGVTTRFIAYPLSGHNADDPIHQSDVDRRYVEWFSTYLR